MNTEQQIEWMRESDYEILDHLLGLLRADLGHRFVISCSTHDSYHIAIYHEDTGNLKDWAVTGSIKATVKTLKENGTKG